MKIKGFTLVDQDKLERALNGTPLSDSSIKGGVANGAYLEDGVWKKNGKALAKEDVTSLEDSILAEYDKLAGLIRRGKEKIKTGSFFDFKANEARTEPKIVAIYKINGKIVEAEDGKKLPGVVRAAKILEEGDAEEDEVDEEEVNEDNGDDVEDEGTETEEDINEDGEATPTAKPKKAKKSKGKNK